MSFRDEMLGKIPEDQRVAVEALLTENPALEAALGGFVNKQKSEFSSSMDKLRGIETEQKTWWEQNAPLVELGQKAKQAGFDPSKTVPPPSPLDDVVRKADLEQRESLILPLIGTLSGLAARHLHEFGEPLDVNALIGHPEAVKIGAVPYYEQMVAPRRAEKAKLAETERIAKAVDEGVRERMSKMTHPSYVSGVGEDTSPLAKLTEAQNVGPTVDAMNDMYQQLVATTRSA